jgi:4-azaleucine resistance transporter AzlC
MQTNWQAFRLGALDSLPLIIAAIPFGILFGALAPTTGMMNWVAIALSSLVFAGSAQYVAIGLIAGGVPVIMIILTTFIVNLRHLLYSLSLAPKYRDVPLLKRLGLSFFLTDETFVTVSQRFQREPDTPKLPYYLGSAIFMYSNWQLCTWIGLWAGGALSGIDSLGLEFAMVTAFIGMLTPMLKKPGNVVSAIIAVLLAWYTKDWPHKSGLIFSLVIAVASATALEIVWPQRKKSGEKYDLG